MTQILRIAMAQFDFPVGAVAQNSDNIRRMIAEARDEYAADIVLFPELALCGYPPEDLLYRPSFLRDCEAALNEIAADVRGIVAVVGWPQAAGSVVYNAASVLRDGGIEQTYRKRELPNYAVFDERRYFDVDPDRDDCVFEVKGTQVGLLICEDLWFAEPIASTVAKGAQLVLVPNASPFEHDKHAQRDELLAQRTRETGAAIAYLNVVGGQDALVFDGASVVADGDSTVHPAAAAFTDQWLWWSSIRSRAISRRCSGWSTATKAAMRWPGARWCAAPATTSPRMASGRRGWGCPVASIPRWCWRSPPMRWGRRTSPRCACRRATPPTCPTTWRRSNAMRWA